MKTRPRSKHTTKKQQRCDRGQLETACDETSPARYSSELARFCRCRVCGNWSRTYSSRNQRGKNITKTQQYTVHSTTTYVAYSSNSITEACTRTPLLFRYFFCVCSCFLRVRSVLVLSVSCVRLVVCFHVVF